MACCQTAPIHYLKLYWLHDSEVPRHSPETNFAVIAKASMLFMTENHTFKSTATSPKDQWVNTKWSLSFFDGIKSAIWGDGSKKPILAPLFSQTAKITNPYNWKEWPHHRRDLLSFSCSYFVSIRYSHYLCWVHFGQLYPDILRNDMDIGGSAYTCWSTSDCFIITRTKRPSFCRC